MILTKTEIKILKFVYAHESVSFKSLCKKFSENLNLTDTLQQLVFQHYLIQIGGQQNNCGDPIPITSETLFTMDSLGSSEVERRQWFNTEYVISHIAVPILLAVISTLITLFLTNVLSLFQ